ncbi:hypothetical protein P7C70_g1520, partial [Phenoliferia sp. Uapishka_3]
MNSKPVIPKFCKAARAVNPGPGYTLECVEVKSIVSDHHFMFGDWGDGLGMKCAVAGHEGAGAVVALGSGVDPSVWKIGDRAGVKPYWPRLAEVTLSRIEQSSCVHDFLYLVANQKLPLSGSYAEYIVTPARYTSRIPDGLPDEIAGPISWSIPLSERTKWLRAGFVFSVCSGSTMYAALKASKAEAGQWVVIPGGGGGVGHMATQYGKALGIRVIAIDTGEDKKEMCMELGAEEFIDFKTCKNVEEEVRRITGGGAHGVIVTGGTASAYKSAPYFLRKGGIQAELQLQEWMHFLQGYLLFDALVGGMQHVDEALAMAARGLIKPRITVLPFKEFPEAMKMLARLRSSKHSLLNRRAETFRWQVQSKVAGRIVIDYNL